MRKKIISIMLSCVLSISMVLPAFADEIITGVELIDENESTIDDELEVEEELIGEDEALPDAASVTDELEYEAVEDIQEDGTVSGDWEYEFVDSSDTSKGISIKGYNGSATEISIPSTIDEYSVTSILNSSFANCTSLTSVEIPNSVTKICAYAFQNCTSLTSIEIPNSVTAIESFAFYCCTNLKKIDIPKSVESIGSNAFGFYYADGPIGKVSSFTISGYTGSEAEKYAKGNGFKFISKDICSYTVAFNGNGATSGNMASITCKKDNSYALTANTYKRIGYTFSGWNTKKDGSGKKYADKAVIKNLSTTNGAKVTLYAQWKISSYTITYKLNGGKNNSKNPASYKITTSDITLKNPTRTGYAFKGWYTDSKLTKKITVIKKGSTGNKTVYAKWAANKYTIKYNANGGSGSMKSKSMTYDKVAKLTKNSFTRKNYTFLGWSTDKKASKAKYKNQAEVKNLTNKSGGTVTLYAVWKKK